MFPKDLFAIRSFRDLWLGQVISRFGDALYYLGFLFMVRKVTGSDAMVGYVGAAETLPYLLFSPYAGTLADKIDRRKIMLWSDLAAAIILTGFIVVTAICKTPPVWSLFVTGFLLSTARSFFMPAKNAAVPRLVPSEKLLQANAYSMMTDQLIWLASMAVSGAILAGLYVLNPYWFYISLMTVNMASFLGSAYFIKLLPEIQPEKSGEQHESTRDEIKAGLRFAKTDRVIYLSILAQFGISLFIAPFFVVYIATNERWFGGKPETLALIEGGFVAGLFFTSLLISKIKIKKPGWAFAGAIGGTGLMVFLMAFSKNFWLFFLWNFLAGIAIAFVDLPMMTYMQLAVPDSYRGRVMSIKNMIMMGVQPVGMAMGGQLLNRLGVQACYAVMGLGFGLSGVAPVLDKRFREAEMPDEQAVLPSAVLPDDEVKIVDQPGVPAGTV